MKLREAVANYVTKKEQQQIPSAFDIIGTIAIFNDFPKELKKKEKKIADVLMQIHPSITTVAKKTGKFSGKLRTPKITIIAGKKTKETIHKENGCFLKLDIEKCYFSPRLSNERLRIAKLVKKDEKILVLFSGVAPYPCVIAKNAQPKEIIAIELNKIAHKYAQENLTINKIKNTLLYQGDITKVLPKIKTRYDRIIMPLPKDAPTYLPLIMHHLKQKGKIHLYLFAGEEEFQNVTKAYQKIFSSVKLTPCGMYAPRVHRICLDLSGLKTSTLVG